MAVIDYRDPEKVYIPPDDETDDKKPNIMTIATLTAASVTLMTGCSTSKTNQTNTSNVPSEKEAKIINFVKKQNPTLKFTKIKYLGGNKYEITAQKYDIKFNINIGNLHININKEEGNKIKDEILSLFKYSSENINFDEIDFESKKNILYYSFNSQSTKELANSLGIEKGELHKFLIKNQNNSYAMLIYSRINNFMFPDNLESYDLENIKKVIKKWIKNRDSIFSSAEESIMWDEVIKKGISRINDLFPEEKLKVPEYKIDYNNLVKKIYNPEEIKANKDKYINAIKKLVYMRDNYLVFGGEEWRKHEMLYRLLIQRLKKYFPEDIDDNGESIYKYKPIPKKVMLPLHKKLKEYRIYLDRLFNPDYITSHKKELEEKVKELEKLINNKEEVPYGSKEGEYLNAYHKSIIDKLRKYYPETKYKDTIYNSIKRLHKDPSIGMLLSIIKNKNIEELKKEITHKLDNKITKDLIEIDKQKTKEKIDNIISKKTNEYVREILKPKYKEILEFIIQIRKFRDNNTIYHSKEWYMCNQVYDKMIKELKIIFPEKHFTYKISPNKFYKNHGQYYIKYRLNFLKKQIEKSKSLLEKYKHNQNNKIIKEYYNILNDEKNILQEEYESLQKIKDISNISGISYTHFNWKFPENIKATTDINNYSTVHITYEDKPKDEIKKTKQVEQPSYQEQKEEQIEKNTYQEQKEEQIEKNTYQEQNIDEQILQELLKLRKKENSIIPLYKKFFSNTDLSKSYNPKSDFTNKKEIGNSSTLNINIKISDIKYKEYFDILDYNFYSIRKIQAEMYELGLIKASELGIFGPKTIKYIYEYHPEYFFNHKIFNKILKRFESYIIDEKARRLYTLNQYKDQNKILELFFNIILEYKENYITNRNGQKGRSWEQYLLKPHNKKLYGKINGIDTYPINGTAIANGLLEIISNEERLKNLPKSNNLYIFKNSTNNKFILAYFLGGRVRVATYISPGDLNAKGGGEYTNLISLDENVWIGGEEGIYENYISSSKNKANVDDDNTAWVMPLAIKINKPLHRKKWNYGEFIHASLNVNGELASHGCIRIPPYYMTVLALYLRELKTQIAILDNGENLKQYKQKYSKQTLPIKKPKKRKTKQPKDKKRRKRKINTIRRKK